MVDRVGAEAADLVGLVFLEVALEPLDMALALEGEHVGGKAVEEHAVMRDDDRAAGIVLERVLECRELPAQRACFRGREDVDGKVVAHVTVLRDGRHISTKPIGEHTHDSLIHDMIGRRIENLFPRSRTGSAGKVALSVEGLSTDTKLKDVSFEARAGEVLGFFGLMGAGRTELAKAIVGYDPIRTGRITIDGTALKPHDTRTAVSLGIGLLTEDRKLEGLMLELPVQQNMSLAALSRFAKAGFVDEGSERSAVQSFVDRFRVKTPSLAQPIKNLSGGNQQKVLLARWLMRGLKVIVVDEPTRGIDVGAKSEIFALIDRLAGEGLAVIMMTSEMPELLGLSDRIAVMAEGRLTATFSREEATQERILNAAIA